MKNSDRNASTASAAQALRRLTCILLLIGVTPLLMGATAQRMWNDGTRLEEQGSYYSAALKYLDALAKNPRHRKAAASIGTAARPAYEQKLEIAEAYEQEERFPDALDEYEQLHAFMKRLEHVGAADFATVDLRKKIGEMADASAEQQYAAGATTLAAGSWELSIGHFRAAQTFRGDYKDSRLLIARAEYGWAEDELGARRYRSAAQHFVAASDGGGAVGVADSGDRAAGLYVAIGRYSLDHGACRKAVDDLQRAAGLVSDPRIDGWAREAEDCAITPVAISAFENSTGRNVAGMAVGELLSDQTAGKVDQGSSRYVRLIERRALDQILAEQGLSQTGIATGSTSQVRGVRYLVLGKLTQVRAVASGPQRQSKSTVGSKPYRCTKTNRHGDSYETTCHSEVRVDYVEVEQSISVQISGSVTVVDVKTGEQLLSRPVEASAQDSVHYVESPTVDGRGVELTMWRHNDGIGVQDRGLKRLVDADRSLTDEGTLASQVVDSLSSQAARAVLDVVDVDDSLRDPAELASTTLD